MAVGNFPCFTPGCAQPVVKQCPGYKSNCGRFYCATHSEGALCIVCSERKAEYDALQDMIADYVRTAETIPNHAMLTSGLEAVGIWAVIVFVGSAVVPYYLACIPLLIGTIIAGVYWRRRTAHKTRIINSSIDDVDRVKPYFREFYKKWLTRSSSTPDEIMSGVMGSTAALAGIGLVAGLAAFSAYQEQRAYDDVHAIREKIDRM